jgi:phage-related protein
MKSAIFHPKARSAIKTFPENVRKALGKAIFDLQTGHTLTFPLSRPMPAVGPGVEEIRIKDASGAFRIFYLCKSTRGIFIFHAFIKKTQSTPSKEIDLGIKRLKEMINEEN